MTTSKTGTHALRKRCPRCHKLRRFYEPPGDQGGTRKPRVGWTKVDGQWVCNKGLCGIDPLAAVLSFRRTAVSVLEELETGNIANARVLLEAALLGTTVFDDALGRNE